MYLVFGNIPIEEIVVLSLVNFPEKKKVMLDDTDEENLTETFQMSS
jgi:hypothetical protein